MVPTRPYLLLSVVLILLYPGETVARCGSRTIQCRTGTGCINLSYVCDGGHDCSDGSDESPDICDFWNFNTYGSYYDVNNRCNNPPLFNQMDQRFCQVFTSKILYYEPPLLRTNKPASQGMNLTAELVATLSTAVNSTLNNKVHKCPMLYNQVGDMCFAFFSPAKMPWAEARQFCKSIYGDLAHFNNTKTFSLVVDYMKEALFSSSYWVGGRFDLDTNAWAWVHDDSPMPLGSPYWTLIYNPSCKTRSPPHTDPFSDPPAPLPGDPCYHYTQAPSHRVQGWCSAMTYEYFYYVNEEECEADRSPLCVLTSTK